MNETKIVGTKALTAMNYQVTGLFRDYEDKINTVLLKEQKLDISFAVHLKKLDSGVAIQTDISFTTEKIKDQAEPSIIVENQLDLFEVTRE